MPAWQTIPYNRPVQKECLDRPVDYNRSWIDFCQTYAKVLTDRTAVLVFCGRQCAHKIPKQTALKTPAEQVHSHQRQSLVLAGKGVFYLGGKTG
jgi:hypothetical protein